MRVFGLTGGIASGKSTVGRMFQELGLPVVDADQIARQIVVSGSPAYQDLVATFGREILDDQGDIDRKRLGQRVFGDPQSRARLNQITHPRIAERTAEVLATLAQQGQPVALYEAALLVENGIHHGLAGLIVVRVDEAAQRKRLAIRDGLSTDDIEQRIHAQLPLEEKLAAATYVIDNQGSLDETLAQVQRVYVELTKKSPA